MGTNFNQEYKHINPSEYIEVLEEDSLWYLHENVESLINNYVAPNSEGKPEDWIQKRKEIVKMFARQLNRDKIFLGNMPEYFNDDDRSDNLDTIVIHHTNTSSNIGHGYINALGLLRLYVPLYRAGEFDIKSKPQPISSGHFYKGRQTFVGYHFLVGSDGDFEQTLKDAYVGFHAGDYHTNCRSVGIAIVNKFNNSTPSGKVINSLVKIISKYKVKKILGHGEVTRKDSSKVDTVCPGETFYGTEGWKRSLIESLKR